VLKEGGFGSRRSLLFRLRPAQKKFDPSIHSRSDFRPIFSNGYWGCECHQRSPTTVFNPSLVTIYITNSLNSVLSTQQNRRQHNFAIIRWDFSNGFRDETTDQLTALPDHIPNPTTTTNLLQLLSKSPKFATH
jgi:hypothetical protein